jgi:CHAT domain-containing protein
MPAGEGRAEALRKVLLRMLRKNNLYSNPYCWAGFIVSGAWARLDCGKRN